MKQNAPYEKEASGALDSSTEYPHFGDNSVWRPSISKLMVR